MTHSEAPERVWIDYTPHTETYAEVSNEPDGHATEYVRADLVQAELCRVCNAYAAEGNMAGATAIDDAARCVAALGENEK